MYSLLHGNDFSNLNIFVDDSCDHGLHVNILQELSSSSKNITALCYQYNPEMYKNKLQSGYSGIRFVDCFSDPLHWMSGLCQKYNKTNPELYEQMMSFLDLTEDKSSRSIILIDDIILFGRCHCSDNEFGNWFKTIKLIYRIMENFDVFLFVNPNLLSPGNLRSIVHLSSFHVYINANKSGSFDCKSIRRKKSGKVVLNEITIEFDTDRKILLLKDVIDDANSTSNVDHTSDLTFNLSLTDKEKEARANTALPYILDESKKSALQRPHRKIESESTGEVIYTPDEVDDFDEEDPDDDLDF